MHHLSPEQSHIQMISNGKVVKLTPSAYRLLSLVESGISSEDIARNLRETQGKEISVSQIEKAKQRLLHQIEEINELPIKYGGLWFRFPFLPELLVQRATTALAFLFKPRLATVLGSILLSFTIFIIYQLQLTVNNDATFNVWRNAFLLYLLSTLVHEFGHASACTFFGAKPGPIGFGVNYYRPVLYSDVSSAWMLKPFQRVVVDLGGIYFQTIVGVIYGMFWVFTHEESLRLSLFLIAYSILFSLSPIMKYDGYWLVSDLLNVHNLSQQKNHILNNLIQKLQGKNPKSLPWSSSILLLIFVYYFVTNVILIVFLVHLIPYAYALFEVYPILLRQFFLSLTSTKIHIDLSEAQKLFVTSLLLIYLLRWCVLILKRVLKHLFPSLFH